MRPADPDDIDARFEALVAQFDEDEIRRLTRNAELGTGRPQPPRGRAPVVVIAFAAVVVVVGLVISLRPDVLDRFGSLRGGGEPAARPAIGPAVARPGPVLTPLAEQDDAFADSGGLGTMLAADPFAGSPAAGYADGEKGLVMPPPLALGGLSRAQVAAALSGVRRLLAAAHLDPATLRGGRPDAFIRLLEPAQRRAFLRSLGKGGPSDSRSRVFSLAPGEAEPATDVVKVEGETTVTPRVPSRRDGHGRPGGVTISVDYLFVYAVNRPGDRRAPTRLVRHYKGEFSAREEDGETVVVVESESIGTAGASCDVHDGFVHPHFSGQPRKVEPSGAPFDPYDRREDVPHPNECRLSLGT